ncbi:MAG: DUF1223 domain-containing protein [bacterium]
MNLLVAMVLLCLMLSVPALAAKKRFESTGHKTVLLQLFTSQGCSSCPPAERWLSRLKDQPGLWDQFIPIALHVDYWDYIGWKDPFAQKQFDQMQYQYKRKGRIRQVYTPGFVLDGHEFRTAYSQDLLLPSSEPGFKLSVLVNADKLTIQYEDTRQLLYHVAIIEMDVKTRITAGENNGLHARQDFVVIAHESFVADAGQINRQLPLISGSSNAQRGLVVWVSSPKDPQPLQATGGWL